MKKLIFFSFSLLFLFLVLLFFPSKTFAYIECYVDGVKVGNMHTYSSLYYAISGERGSVLQHFNFLIEKADTTIEFWIKEEYLREQPLFKLGNSSWIPASSSKREIWNGGIRFFAKFTAPIGCGECWANVMYRYVGDGKIHYCEEKRPEYKKSDEDYPNYLNSGCLNSSGCNLVYTNARYGWFYQYPSGPEIRGIINGGGSCDNYLFCLNNYCAPFSLNEGRCYYNPITLYPTTNGTFRALKTINSQKPPPIGSSLVITSVEFGGFTIFYKFSDTVCGGSQGGGGIATPTPTPAYICPLSLQQLDHNTGTALIDSYNENQYANFIANKTGYIDRVEILGELDRDVAKGNKVLTCKITDQTGTLNLGESLPNDGPFSLGQNWLTVYFSSFPSVIDGNSYRLYCKVDNKAGGGWIYWRDLLKDKTNKTRKIYICKQDICPLCPSLVTDDDVPRRDGNYNKAIRWSDVNYEDRYEIYLCQTDSSGECFPRYLATVGRNVTSYTADNNGEGFPPGSKVIYEVRPIKAGCDPLNCSDQINNVPAPPSVSPSVTPACVCGNWQNLSCGDCDCVPNEICQVQYCYYNGDPTQGQCDFNTQCVEDPSCQKTWFQTQEGAVHTQNEIISFMPSGNFFSLEGLGGYPGIVSYGGEEVIFGLGSVSSLGWLANTTFVNWFDFDYFKKITEVSSFEELEEIFQENLSSDKDIFGFRGNLKLGESLNIGTRKIVILVEGKLLINQPITVDINNGGSLVIVASEGIGISKDISSLSGFFITNEGFYSSVENEYSANDFNEGTPSSQQLIVNGGVIAKYFRLTRDLGTQRNKTTPAEKFVYQPKLFLNLNSSLWRRASLWEELAP
ncbi:MAG: hypothetical protein ACPLKP_03170 [Microgenomates group bacterium]